MEKDSVLFAIDELKEIYGDTLYFIDAITDEYGFYGKLISAMKRGETKISLDKRSFKKTIDEQWVSAIESCLPAIEMATKQYGVGIEEREEVLPIEVSRNITSKSLRHLAQHTNFINKIDENGVLPSKILNVFYDETLLTYENKFVNTLIKKLYTFVESRLTSIKKGGYGGTDIELGFTCEFNYGNNHTKVSLTIDDQVSDMSADVVSLPDRVEHIYQSIMQFMQSPFANALSGAYILPPVIRTNAISKNKYLRQCLDLWDYIDAYEKIGYVVETQNSSDVKPNEALIKELYTLLSLQYTIFKYNHSQSGIEEFNTDKHPKRVISPEFVTRQRQIEADEYNIDTTKYRRTVVPTTTANMRALAKDEKLIHNAIKSAISRQKKIDAINDSYKRSSLFGGE